MENFAKLQIIKQKAGLFIKSGLTYFYYC